MPKTPQWFQDPSTRKLVRVIAVPRPTPKRKRPRRTPPKKRPQKKP